MAEKLVLRAVDDFGEGAVGYLTNEGVSLLPVPTTVKPQMYVKALETIEARRAGRFEEVEKQAIRIRGPSVEHRPVTTAEPQRAFVNCIITIRIARSQT